MVSFLIHVSPYLDVVLKLFLDFFRLMKIVLLVLTFKRIVLYYLFSDYIILYCCIPHMKYLSMFLVFLVFSFIIFVALV